MVRRWGRSPGCDKGFSDQRRKLVERIKSLEIGIDAVPDTLGVRVAIADVVIRAVTAITGALRADVLLRTVVMGSCVSHHLRQVKGFNLDMAIFFNAQNLNMTVEGSMHAEHDVKKKIKKGQELHKFTLYGRYTTVFLSDARGLNKLYAWQNRY